MGPGDEGSFKRGPPRLGSRGDDLEPTLEAGPCLEYGLPLTASDIEEVHHVVFTLEELGIDEAIVTVYSEQELESGFRVLWDPAMECFRVASLVVRGCGGESARLVKAADWPEVSAVALERDCTEIVIPLDPPYRVKRAVEKLGLDPSNWRPLGVRLPSPIQAGD